MNVIPKASALDVAGVVGLIAFLADAKACAARLKELQDAAVAATVAESKAAEAMAQAASAVAAADDITKSAHKLYDDTLAAKLAVADQQTDLEERLGKVAELEKDQVMEATSLTSLEVHLKTRETDLDNRDKALHDAEVEVALQKKEYDEKLERLRAVTA